MSELSWADLFIVLLGELLDVAFKTGVVVGVLKLFGVL